ncbi:hypothetical protein K1719_001217 [Acacia pycnantha]|nr:hypothetical protein K1719_001217 [Acacia pycnantha]
MKANVIRRHTSMLKPFLTNENMVARLRFCLSTLEDHSIPNSPTFKSMLNIIHIEEKWFYMTKKKENYYLGASVEDPHRTCKNNNFITKVMFLVALARPRFDNEELLRAACETGFDIHVVSQPPNSPDLNELDLGYFNAIQALQHKEAPKIIDDLISVVKKSYDNLSSFETNKIFLTLQATMVEVMKVGGSNKYKLPHWYKNVLQREGGLPSQFQCDASIIEVVLAHLREVDA